MLIDVYWYLDFVIIFFFWFTWKESGWAVPCFQVTFKQFNARDEDICLFRLASVSFEFDWIIVLNVMPSWIGLWPGTCKDIRETDAEPVSCIAIKQNTWNMLSIDYPTFIQSLPAKSLRHLFQIRRIDFLIAFHFSTPALVWFMNLFVFALLYFCFVFVEFLEFFGGLTHPITEWRAGSIQSYFHGNFWSGLNK